jgi:hypothetical protein
MKVGDIVMFDDYGRYSKWFFGRFAKVKHYTPIGDDGHAHCRVEWLTPVKYHDQWATISDFPADKFTVC